MLDPEPCSVEEHLARILAGVTPLPVEATPVVEALGLVTVEDVFSPMALPPFDNSAMDGYAVRRADVEGASDADPVVLPVVGQIGAGQADLRELAPGSAAKIMTGAPIPTGADAVVPYEWTDRGAERVSVRQVPGPGEHVRPRGDDVEQGELLLEAGTLINPRHVGLLASVGLGTVRVRRRPRVSILSTGSELRDPGSEVGHDSIFDGNSYMLAAAAARGGCVVDRVGIVPDDAEQFLATLGAQLAHSDLVITSGGVSQGDFDVVKEALRSKGVWFGPVRMQPAKPQGFGVLEGVPIVTLPGNPVSSYISFEVFVLPALRSMTGHEPVSRPPVEGTLTTGVRSPAGRRQYRRGRTVRDALGLQVVPVGGPGSHLVGDLAHANCLFVVPEDVTSLDAGATVDVLFLDGAH